MHMLVSNPSTDYFNVSDYSLINDALQQTITTSCTTVMPTAPTAPTQTITTTTPTPTTTVTTSIPPPPPGCTSSLVDIVIVVDASGSITPNDFTIIQNFITTFVTNLDVDSGNTRVGLVSFSNASEPRWNLNTYSRRADIVAQVNALSQSAGTTNTADALNYVRTTMLTAAAGDRPNTANLVILLTDGGSNNGASTLAEAFLVRQMATIVAIGVGNWLSMYELNNVASYPYQANVIFVNNFTVLQSFSAKLRDVICLSK